MTLCSDCSAPLMPIVAWDIDGTLAEYHRHLYNMICNYYTITEPHDTFWDGRGDYEVWMDLSRDAYRDAKLAFRQGGFKRWAPPFEGIEDAYFVMETLRNEQRLEVWITTTRPWLRMDNVDPDTRHWLNMHFPCFDHLLYGDDKYRMLADRVDPHRVVAIFEDLPEKYEEAVHYFGKAAVLVERPHNEWYRRHDGYMATTVTGLRSAALHAERMVEEWHSQHATSS